MDVEQAKVIAHTWGVELVFAADGFDDGGVFRAAFRGADGALVPAGEFLGTGDKQITCNMQSALLREDTTAFVVMDARGDEVLAVEL